MLALCVMRFYQEFIIYKIILTLAFTHYAQSYSGIIGQGRSVGPTTVALICMHEAPAACRGYRSDYI